MKWRTEFIGDNGQIVSKSLYDANYYTRKRAARLAMEKGCTTLKEMDLLTGEVMDLSDYLKAKAA